jgi:hypothetical protein
MKKLTGFLLNITHICAILFSGLGYAYAPNLLNVMNTLAVFMGVISILVTIAVLMETDLEKLTKIHKSVTGTMFALRQWLFYVPTIVLASWFGYYGTLIIILFMGVFFAIAVFSIRKRHEELSLDSSAG